MVTGGRPVPCSRFESVSGDVNEAELRIRVSSNVVYYYNEINYSCCRRMVRNSPTRFRLHAEGRDKRGGDVSAGREPDFSNQKCLESEVRQRPTNTFQLTSRSGETAKTSVIPELNCRSKAIKRDFSPSHMTLRSSDVSHDCAVPEQRAHRRVPGREGGGDLISLPFSGDVLFFLSVASHLAGD